MDIFSLHVRFVHDAVNRDDSVCSEGRYALARVKRLLPKVPFLGVTGRLGDPTLD